MVITEENLARIIAEIHEEMYLEVMTMPFCDDNDDSISDSAWRRVRVGA